MLNQRVEEQALKNDKKTSKVTFNFPTNEQLLDKGALDGLEQDKQLIDSINIDPLEEEKSSELIQEETRQPGPSSLLLSNTEEQLFTDHDVEDTIQEESKNITLEARSQQVTDRLLELQQKHKEISDRVQNVLMETVDLALGGAPPELKEYLIRNSPDQTPSHKKKSKRRARREEAEELMRLQYTQGVGSVPYGLPCLAVTRRTTQQQLQLKEIERVNTKLCQIMRVPADFIDVEKGSDIDPDEEYSSEI